MAIARQQAGNTATAGTGTTIAPTLTSTPKAGNLMTVGVVATQPIGIVNGGLMPAGWAQLCFDDVQQDVALYAKVVAPGDGTAYTFTQAASGSAMLARIDEWNGALYGWAFDLAVAGHSPSTETSHLLSPGTTHFATEVAIGIAGFPISEPTCPIGAGQSMTNDTTNLLSSTWSMSFASRILSATNNFTTTQYGVYTTTTTGGGFAFASFAALPGPKAQFMGQAVKRAAVY